MDKQREKRLKKFRKKKVLITGGLGMIGSTIAHKLIGTGAEVTLIDAFIESGTGTGNTYIGKFPSFRIDYIFHSKAFDSYNFKKSEVKLSDHYPIQCRLKLK